MERTRKKLKEQGLKSAITEHWIPRAKCRRDLFGIIDLIALDSKRGVLGIQVCGQDFSVHHHKFLTERRAACIDWLNTPGAHLEIWSWRPLKEKYKNGRPKTVWAVRIQEYTLKDFDVLA